MQCYMSLATNQLLVVMSANLMHMKLGECCASTSAVRYFASHYIDAERHSLFVSTMQAATALLNVRVFVTSVRVTWPVEAARWHLTGWGSLLSAARPKHDDLEHY